MIVVPIFCKEEIVKTCWAIIMSCQDSGWTLVTSNQLFLFLAFERFTSDIRDISLSILKYTILFVEKPTYQMNFTRIRYQMTSQGSDQKKLIFFFFLPILHKSIQAQNANKVFRFFTGLFLNLLLSRPHCGLLLSTVT